jgi:hypothetical protein
MQPLQNELESKFILTNSVFEVFTIHMVCVIESSQFIHVQTY